MEAVSFFWWEHLGRIKNYEILSINFWNPIVEFFESEYYAGHINVDKKVGNEKLKGNKSSAKNVSGYCVDEE